MAVPNYTYLKMKMSGTKGIITVGLSIEHAFDCDVKCVKHTEALALDGTLVADMEKLANEGPTPPPSMWAASRLPNILRRYPAALEDKVLWVSSTLDLK
jgi:hypothetical protein